MIGSCSLMASTRKQQVVSKDAKLPIFFTYSSSCWIIGWNGYCMDCDYVLKSLSA